MSSLPFIDSHDLAFFQQGRTYGEADFEFDCGRISHGLLHRYNNLVCRDELCHEIVLGVLFELAGVLLEQKYSEIGRYKIGRIAHYPVVFAKLESAVVLVRDFNRDASSRASLMLLKSFNAALYYEPIFEVLYLGYHLGFGNTHFDFLYHSLLEKTDLQEVLMPGQPNWCEFDSQQVQDILSAISICERCKLESLYCRESRMVNLSRLFSSNESHQERFHILRPLFMRADTVPEMLKYLWPALSLSVHSAIHMVEQQLFEVEAELSSYEEVLRYLENESRHNRVYLTLQPSEIRSNQKRVRKLEKRLCEQLARNVRFPNLDHEITPDSFRNFVNSYTFPSFTDPLIQSQPRLNIRFRQYRMSGRWVEKFPIEHQQISAHLLTYKYTREGIDLISYWERLFYERAEEVPEVIDMFHEMSIDG